MAITSHEDTFALQQLLLLVSKLEGALLLGAMLWALAACAQGWLLQQGLQIVATLCFCGYSAISPPAKGFEAASAGTILHATSVVQTCLGTLKSR